LERQWLVASKEVHYPKVIKEIMLVSVFWDKGEILFVNYLEKCATITARYYVALLDKLKQLVSKR
jgi:hypothetical protein